MAGFYAPGEEIKASPMLTTHSVKAIGLIRDVICECYPLLFDEVEEIATRIHHRLQEASLMRDGA